MAPLSRHETMVVPVKSQTKILFRCSKTQLIRKPENQATVVSELKEMSLKFRPERFKNRQNGQSEATNSKATDKLQRTPGHVEKFLYEAQQELKYPFIKRTICCIRG